MDALEKIYFDEIKEQVEYITESIDSIKKHLKIKEDDFNDDFDDDFDDDLNLNDELKEDSNLNNELKEDNLKLL